MTQRTQPLARLATAALPPLNQGLAQSLTLGLTLSLILSLILGTTGCNGTSSPNQIEIPEGTYNFENNFFVDNNFNGIANEVRVARQFYGRLVSVASCTPTGGIIEVVQTDFVIDPREESTFSAPFTLSTNPANGSQMLCIAEDINDTAVDPTLGSSGRERFLAALTEVAGGVRPVADIGFIGVGNFTMVPRNAAFVLQFDDLIDPATINSSSVQVLSGNPSIIPVTARIFADQNFGALADFDGEPGLEFYPTRVIIDPAISESETLATGFPTLLTGFPSSPAANLANIQVRVQTQLPNGQVPPLLQNPDGQSIVTSQNGTFDFGSSSRDVVRAFRSGGETDITGDPFNGFLPDATQPSILGAQGISVNQIQPTAADPLEFLVGLSFNSILCAQEPQEGDVITTSDGISALVLRDDPSNSDLSSGVFSDNDGTAMNVRVRVLTPIPAQFPQDDPGAAFDGNGEGPAQYTVVYDDREFEFGGDRNRPECFISVTPNATLFPDAPNMGITAESEFGILFSEPMNAALLEPYESIRLTRQRAIPLEPADFVVGRLQPSGGLQMFTYDPTLPLEHTNGASESFFLSFPETSFAPVDLAGNPLTAGLSPFVEYTFEPTAATSETGSRAIRFSSRDEEAPFGDLTSDDILMRLPRAEWAGQISFAADTGRVRPRPVVREQIFVSPSQEIVGTMTPGLGTTLPLNPRGARTQFIWRDIDFGLSLYDGNDFGAGLDVSRLNVDVEGVFLSPRNSQPVFERIPEFTMNMAHSLVLPNESVAFGALTNSNSGMNTVYANNILDQNQDPLQEVHARELGYTINPGDQTLTSDGITTLIPLPQNQGVPDADKRYYTWRDTAILALGAPSTNVGAPVERISQVSQFFPTFNFVDPCGFPFCGVPGALNPLYITGQVRTAALPLLLDCRAFNTGTASSGNQFDHSIAFGFVGQSTLPSFRAFSAGGTNQGGSPVIIDPDNETSANGGFDPTSAPPGAETPGLDNTVYHGALDLVVRISRTTSIFFPTADPSSFVPGNAEVTSYPGTYGNATFAEPTLFPTADNQPAGTSIEFAYRGTSSDIIGGADERVRADFMDPYGDFFQGLPINYTAGTAAGIPGQSDIGDASCFDGSFQYIFFDIMGNSLTNVGATFLAGNTSWRDSVALISGAQFFQIRMSFINNLVTGDTAELSALGMSWSEN